MLPIIRFSGSYNLLICFANVFILRGTKSNICIPHLMFTYFCTILLCVLQRKIKLSKRNYNTKENDKLNTFTKWYKKLNVVGRVLFTLVLSAVFYWILSVLFHTSFDWLIILYYGGYALLILGVLKLNLRTSISWVIYWLTPFIVWNLTSIYVHHNFKGFKTIIFSLLATFAFSAMLLALSEAFKEMKSDESNG